MKTKTEIQERLKELQGILKGNWKNKNTGARAYFEGKLESILWVLEWEAQ